MTGSISRLIHSWSKFLLRIVGCMLAALPVQAQPLRVMTFNVRFLTPNDGANNWDAQARSRRGHASR